MQAGIVVYQRQGNQLVGLWSHEEIGGAPASEIVHDVAPGPLEGDWPVEIFAPGGAPYFTGRLSSTKLGSCVKLIWKGSFLGGKPACFEGIGYASGADTLSATFELITA
jgi:hypothetical protein